MRIAPSYYSRSITNAVLVLLLCSLGGMLFAAERFNKIGHDGSELPLSAKPGATARAWACLRDNRTGLTWEIKTDDKGFRDRQWTYTPYDSNPETNGGYPGYKDTSSGDCVRELMTEGSCNTEAYIEAVVKSRLCGYDDWRLPTVRELVAVSSETSDARPSRTDKLLPNTASGWYWTGTEQFGVTNFSRVILLPPRGQPTFYDGSYLVLAVRGEKKIDR